MPKTIRAKALECKQNNKVFYLTILDNILLKDICFVSRRDADPKKGFQRNLNISRAKDIAEYLDKVKGVIPAALILSAQDITNFSFDRKSQKISFLDNEKSFMVLDGQHRLYGLMLATNTYSVPVIIFNKLTTTDEVNLFVDINTTQKGVPTSLLLDIKNLTGKETKKEERQRDLFNRLNKKSVLAGLMSPSKSQVGKISRVSFNQATKDIYEGGFFQYKDDTTIYNGIKNYLEAVDIIFNKTQSAKAKITNTNLLRAIFAIFNDIIDESLDKYNDLKVESLVNCLEPISRIDFDSYAGTSNAAVQKIIQDMENELKGYDRKYRDVDNEQLF